MGVKIIAVLTIVTSLSITCQAVSTLIPATIYVDVYDGGSDTSDCGSSNSSACKSIDHALMIVGDNTSALVYLISSNKDSGYSRPMLPSVVSDRQNVTIDGSQLGELILLMAVDNNTSPQDYPWLVFLNCSNVAVRNLHVDITNLFGHFFITFQDSHMIEVTDTIVTHPPRNFTAILFKNSWPAQVLSTRIAGNSRGKHEPPNVEADYNLSPVYFEAMCDTAWCNSSPTRQTNVPCCSSKAVLAGDAPSLFFGNCVFSNLGLDRLYRLYLRHGVKSGTAIHFYAINCTRPSLNVSDSQFTNNSSPYDTTIRIVFDNGTADGVAIVTGCLFQDNWVYIGGGISFFVFDTNSSNSHGLHLVNSHFINNSAVLEGGALLASFKATDSSKAIVFVDQCSFHGNTGGVWITAGLVGGAISISSSFPDANTGDSSPVYAAPRLRIQNTDFVHNTGTYGSAIFLKGMYTLFENITMRDQAEGSCVWASTTSITLAGSQVYTDNTDALYGGVFALYDFSQLIFQKDVAAKFENNAAEAAGGAIYADLTSSTADIAQSIVLFTDIGNAKQCFLEAHSYNDSLNFNYSTGGPGAGSKVYFRNNSARLGNDIYAYSFSPCTGSQMLPEPRGMMQKNITHSSVNVASGAAWMFLSRVTCPCLKPVLNSNTSHWWFTRSSSREQVWDVIRKNNESYPFAILNAFLENATLFKQSTSGVGVLPDSEYFLLTPWATTTWRWYYPRYAGKLEEFSDLTTLLEASHYGNLTLYPAPGQEFQLTTDLADFYLTLAPGPCDLKVREGNVLIQHEGYEYAKKDAVYFGSLNAVAIAIVGAPGSTGSLQIQTQSQIRSNSVMKLVVPFRLAPCRLGFEPTDMMKDPQKVQEYVEKAKTQPVSSSTSQLSCACLSTIAGVHSCKDGTDLLMQWPFWAGSQGSTDYDPALLPETMKVINLDEQEDNMTQRKFATGLCPDEFCSDHQRTVWSLQKESSCSERKHRHGLLCGECVKGYYLTGYYSQACAKCSARESIVNTVMFFVGVFAYTGVAIALMSYFDVGRSSNFEAWVNYDQMCAFLIRRQTAMTTFTTFSLPICMRWLTAGMQVVLLYVTPFYTLVWVLLIFQLSRLGRFRRVFHTYSVIPTMWAAISFSFGSAIFPSFLLLSCHSFNGEYVFFSDARMICGGKSHLKYLISAILVIFLVCFSAPIVLYSKRASPAIKPLFDVYLSYVKDNRRWWIFFSLCRRVVVAIISALIDTQSLVRQLLLAVLMVGFFLVHYFVQPYKKEASNNVESLFLANAAIFAIFNIPAPTDVTDDYIILLWIIFLAPTPVYFCYGVYKHRDKIRRHMANCKLPKSVSDYTVQGRTEGASEQTPLTVSERVRVKKWSQQVRPGEVRDELLLEQSS